MCIGRNVAMAFYCPIFENNNQQYWAGERRLRKVSLPPTAEPHEGWRHCAAVTRGLDTENRRHSLRAVGGPAGISLG